MKKILSLLAVILTAAIGAHSQAPGIFNYQGVARNSVGNVLINKSIALRLTIRNLTSGGAIVYQEVRGVTTNPFGLFNAQVGDAGATSTIGTIAGVPWGVGDKYLQVEIDPNGGSTFINIGTARIASVPYSLYTSLAGDLVLPFNKSQIDLGTLFKITNLHPSSPTATALEGVTNSNGNLVSAIIGTVTSAAAGSFSAGVKGINNGNAANGIGVYGTQNGTGWGVYGITPGGIGVYGTSTTGVGTQGTSTSGNGVVGTSTSGIGVYGTSTTGNAGRFENTNAANGADALQASTNGTGSSWALRATSTGAQGAGIFVYNNAGGAANALRVTNNGSGAAISALATNSGSAGTFTNTNAGNGSSTVVVTSNSNNGVGLQVNQTGTSQVSAIYGNISTTTAGSAAVNGADFSSGGASGIELRTYGVVGQTGLTGIGVGGYANSGGTALRGSGGGLTGYALQTTGRVQHAGIGENLNWILRSDAVGNATWVNPAVLLGGLFWSTTGNIGNVDATNFIGNIDNVPFNIRVNNQKAGRLDQPRDNTFYGIESGSANYTTIGRENTGIGVNALNRNTTGNNNTGIGSDVLYFNTTGTDNTGTGRQSLYNNTSGSNNSGLGREALISNTTGNFNTASGWDALYSNTTGSNNTADGQFALVTNTTGSRNTGVGSQADVASVALTNATAIGANAQVSASNSMVLGSINAVNGGTANVNVGIGITAPAYRLDVEASNGGSNGVRVRNTTSFATVDILGVSTDQAIRFGKNGAIYSGINTLPDGDHITFFKFGVGNLMAVNVNTGNLGVGGTIINPVAKVHARGFNVANNLYSSSTGFLGATGIGSNDITAQPGNEKWGMHTFVNGAVGTQHAIFAEPGTTAAINTGLFGRVSSAPAGGQSYGLFAFDPVNNANTWAATIRGRLQYQDGSENTDWILKSTDPLGDATWVDPTVLLPGAFLWTRVGTNLWNTNLGDNVGVGTVAPTHRLTVSHGGSTGISVRSTAGFSVVDIDGQNGDAALRFGNNGTNQWNMRNRPADNYLEIFELGGGGSRMVIQDGSGFVGIGGPGAVAAPAYQLDVEHGGATGIRSKTAAASFSVVDIDAGSGDAALRFQKLGVGQWNTRNRPADNYYEIFELGGGGSRVVIQDGTGNVGIGATVAPAYRLDVEHGGATGIRSKSTASFSVVDIDAASGDAALRFANAGVNQWNIRNRPGDDYLEIFELGGGGSRMAIQDGTGNVGIGTTGAGIAYRLDVQHGGATGIRSQSTATFSVIDIDAANGDAALRFQKAGVNQWNTRNRPADDYYEIFELGGGGSRVVIQDGTGNVGVGATVSPAYKLDVEHGGATGIRSKSTGTFSLMDIDAANGDAALRFAKAGVNQWNTRNNPATDDYQIFELGGGGERFQIQDGSGNVGIGGISPAYRLDVQHGGATGVHVVSTGTFSVVDIDGSNGDAALRFQRAGVNQWNTRNNPANDDYQIFELGGGGERVRIENTTGKVVISGDATVLGVKAFTIDHPLDPANKILMHAASESNEVINFYSGNVTTDASGKVTVQLPDYFEAINKDFRYQLTVVGTFAQAIISKEVSNNKFEIATSVPNVKVSWEVKGVRNDARMQRTPFVAVQDKPAEQKGKYWDPASHNQPASKSVSYDANLSSSLQDVNISPAKVANPSSTTGGSLDYTAPATPTNKPVDNSGSVANTEPTKAVVKPAMDNSGSVANTEPAKAVVKTLDVNSGSVVQTEATKPATKKADNSGSVSEEMQKPVNKTQEPADKTIVPAKQVKKILPEVLKGTSMDPDAKPIVPAAKTPDVKVPEQNSGNTQPAVEQKQVPVKKD
jgi:hypothetical protein